MKGIDGVKAVMRRLRFKAKAAMMHGRIEGMRRISVYQHGSFVEERCEGVFPLSECWYWDDTAAEYWRRLPPQVVEVMVPDQGHGRLDECKAFMDKIRVLLDEFNKNPRYATDRRKVERSLALAALLNSYALEAMQITGWRNRTYEVD